MELIKMTRHDGEVANVRPEWVEQWKGWGWQAEPTAADQQSGGEQGDGTSSDDAPNGGGPSVNDGLDDLDAEQLHALAKERGVKVHHALGADKVRVALREAA